MPRILVTYASRFGSTAEVAAAVGDELTAAGFDVDVLVAGPQIQVAKYDALVVGAPSYGRNWLPDAVLLVMANAERLSAMPVALFTTGMLGVKNPKSALREHEEIVETLREHAPGLNPLSTALFHGSFDRDNLPFCLRLLDRMAGTPRGDHRSWEAIRSWAQHVGELFADALNETGTNAAPRPGEQAT